MKNTRGYCDRSGKNWNLNSITETIVKWRIKKGRSEGFLEKQKWRFIYVIIKFISGVRKFCQNLDG